MNIIPYVIDKTPQGERAFDIFSRLLKERIIFIGSSIEVDMANSVIAQLLYLEKESKSDEINMYINCWGGQVTAALSIIDTMKHIKPDVATTVVGVAASGGAWLLAAGTEGKRFALPNAEVMLHQPLGGVQGQATDIEIAAEHIVKTREKLFGMIADYTGKSKKTIADDFERDKWMSAKEAKSYGLVDKILK
jgi:ATP-dependent Clp protease protease subunit